MKWRWHMALAMSLTLVSAVPASAVGTGGPPPNRWLTANERAAVMAGMTRQERAILGPLFKDKDSLVVGYARNLVTFETQPDGSLRPLVANAEEGTLLRIDARTPMPASGSAGQEEAGRVSTMTPYAATGQATPGTSLYQSITVLRQCGTCLVWTIHHFYNWSGTTGMGPNNGNKDRIGTSWGSNYLALKSGSYYFNGHYTSGSHFSAIDQYVQANAGVGWGFREWQHPSLAYYSDWGYGNSAVVESSFHNQATNFQVGYAHTGIGTTGGSITFGFASINFNGADDFEWQFALVVTT